MENENAEVIFSVLSTDPVVATVSYVFDKVQKHNQGKFSNLARYSREGFIEKLLELGITAMDNAVDADIKRRDEAAYVLAMSKLDAPVSSGKAEDAEKDAKALQVYLGQIAALKRKFHIGGEAKEV